MSNNNCNFPSVIIENKNNPGITLKFLKRLEFIAWQRL